MSNQEFITYLENKLLLSDLPLDRYEAIQDCLNAIRLGEKALITHFDMWFLSTSEPKVEDEEYLDELYELSVQWFMLKNGEYDSYQEVDSLTKRLMEIVK